MTRQELVNELESTAGKNNVYRVAKHMAKFRQHVVGVNCVKDANGKVLVENDQVKEEWKNYKKKLLNEENTWDNAIVCENVEGHCELIRRDGILKALRMMKKSKAAGPTRIVSEMFMADEDCRVEWLTSLCNLIVAQGRIPDDWKSSILLPVFKWKGGPMECGSYRAIKLLKHAMKVIERVFKRRIREKVKIDAMQCSLDLCQGKELQMQSSQYGRCNRNMGVKERSSTLLL